MSCTPRGMKYPKNDHWTDEIRPDDIDPWGLNCQTDLSTENSNIAWHKLGSRANDSSDGHSFEGNSTLPRSGKGPPYLISEERISERKQSGHDTGQIGGQVLQVDTVDYKRKNKTIGKSRPKNGIWLDFWISVMIIQLLPYSAYSLPPPATFLQNVNITEASFVEEYQALQNQMETSHILIHNAIVANQSDEITIVDEANENPSLQSTGASGEYAFQHRLYYLDGNSHEEMRMARVHNDQPWNGLHHGLNQELVISGDSYQDSESTEVHHRRHRVSPLLQGQMYHAQNDFSSMQEPNSSNIVEQTTSTYRLGSSHDSYEAESISLHPQENLQFNTDRLENSADTGISSALENLNFQENMLENTQDANINPNPEQTVTVSVTFLDETRRFFANALTTFGDIRNRILLNTNLSQDVQYVLQEEVRPHEFRDVTILDFNQQLLFDRSFLVLPTIILVYNRCHQN